MTNPKNMVSDRSQLLIYRSPSGEIKIDVRLEEETVWLTQAHMAELFQVKPQNITMHLKNIYAEGELSEQATCKEFLQVQTEGTRRVERKRKFYNLDAIISVGYRVKSHVATQFRIWATQCLKEYLIKGFVLDDERFKSGSSMNYFTELQERIRDIRLSERFFYQKIKDIYATSIDYNPKDEKTVEFFKIVQNKLLWAISRQTAAELVYRRADAELPLMGMLSFDKKGDVAVRKSDVSIAKNYLTEEEIKLLGLLVEQYLAFAETMAQQHVPMYMKDWIQRLDAVLQLNGREILSHAGKISHQKAVEKSALEYAKYKEVQKQVQREESLRELENDIERLKKKSS
ncbi:virulence RhuM family protein [Candidatus Electrothrix sp.]|uniref:virulence RhuM family protein n=1 Tax=Candidatus Electrothrix sp. TaxID=2170559 RepID=UPI004055B514